MVEAVARLDPRYEVVRRLGGGGMGQVFLVRHRELGELRVLKVMRGEVAGDEEMRRRFVREARLASRLRHPNIAHLYDFDSGEGGEAWLVLEYIDGVTFHPLVARRPLPPPSLVVALAVQALAALGFLHRRGFLHRDVSPDNLMVTRDGDGRPLVKLIDLGIARPLAPSVALTAAGGFIGKLRYASPEQLEGGRGTHAVGPPSDLYSFGIVLFELLTGRFPIRGQTAESLLRGHFFEPPLGFAEADPAGRVPATLREAVLACLAKDPGERPTTAGELDERLRTSLRPSLDGEEEHRWLLDVLPAAAHGAMVGESDLDGPTVPGASAEGEGGGAQPAVELARAVASPAGVVPPVLADRPTSSPTRDGTAAAWRPRDAPPEPAPPETPVSEAGRRTAVARRAGALPPAPEPATSSRDATAPPAPAAMPLLGTRRRPFAVGAVALALLVAITVAVMVYRAAVAQGRHAGTTVQQASDRGGAATPGGAPSAPTAGTRGAQTAARSPASGAVGGATRAGSDDSARRVDERASTDPEEAMREHGGSSGAPRGEAPPPTPTSPRATPRGGAEQLLRAAARGDAATVEARLTQGVAVGSRDPEGNGALALAAAAKRAATVALLLRAGADPDAANVRRVTPLMMAADAGALEAALLLLAAGAAVDAANDTGMTALMIAAGNGDGRLCRALLDRGADRSRRNLRGATAEGIAAARGHDRLAAFLASYEVAE